MKKKSIILKRRFLKGSKISFSNKKKNKFFLINFKKKKIFIRKIKKFIKKKISVKDINYIDKF